MNDEHSAGATSVLFSFLLGGLIGAGLALLLAPQSGVDTRRRIGEMSGDFRDKADESYKQARDSMEGVYERGRDFVEDKKSVLTSAIEAGKEAFQREKEKESQEA